jgi:hypothetical protein
LKWGRVGDAVGVVVGVSRDIDADAPAGAGNVREIDGRVSGGEGAVSKGCGSDATGIEEVEADDASLMNGE